MTKTARVYGGSLYDLAAEEKLDGQIMEQMIAIRQIFRENPGYLKLLGEPAIPEDERLKMIEERKCIWFRKQMHPFLADFAWNWRAYSLTVQYRAVFPVFRRN